MAVDLNIKEVADPRLEVVDLKQEVPERRSGGIRPDLTPGPYWVFTATWIKFRWQNSNNPREFTTCLPVIRLG